MNTFLYTVTVLIWGSTWLAIRYQLGEVPPQVSVAYRSALAALLLFAWAKYKGLPLRFKPKDHLYMALLGGLMFSLNFVLFYKAQSHLTSGLVAIIFSMALLLNIVNGALFLGRKVSPIVVVGAAFGLAGIVTVFWPELLRFSLANATGQGIALSLGGTLLFSLGNMVSARNQSAGIPTLSGTAYGLAYGAALLFLVAIQQGLEFRFDTSPSYVLSLLYLALFGSVLGFGCYLTLLGRIGADRAAYATVLFPIVALILSTVFERYVWEPRALAGVLLIIMGNVVMLTKPTMWGTLTARLRA